MLTNRLWARVEELRSAATGESIDRVLRQESPPEFLTNVDRLVEASREAPAHFGYLLPPRIAARLPGAGQQWSAIEEYCVERLHDELVAPAHLLEVLLTVFEPPECGAWISPNALRDHEPNLRIDEDGLASATAEYERFEKEGLLTERHWIILDRELPGGHLVGGFVDRLLKVARDLDAANSVRLAPVRDALLSVDYHETLFTRAYIRGPRGISRELLDSPAFPEDASGTVTAHSRVETDPLMEFVCPLERTEFMWSKRGEVKTIQVEELRQPNEPNMQVSNRYLHARWDSTTGVFKHLDGALRSYCADTYVGRLQADMKKFQDKADGYRKLFRIDAELSLNTWSDLTARFFDGNELVLEYLGGAR